MSTKEKTAAELLEGIEFGFEYKPTFTQDQKTQAYEHLNMASYYIKHAIMAVGAESTMDHRMGSEFFEVWDLSSDIQVQIMQLKNLIYQTKRNQ